MRIKCYAVALWTSVAAIGCSAFGPQLDAPSGGGVRVRRQHMTCNQAMHAAHGAVIRLGYRIEDVEAARPNKPGRIEAERTTGASSMSPEGGTAQQLSVRVSCTNEGALFEVRSSESRFSLRSDFDSALSKVTAVAPRRPRRSASTAKKPERGMRIAVEPLRGAAVGARLGVAGTEFEVLPVWVSLRNFTDRLYQLNTEDIVLTAVQGGRAEPLQAESVLAGVDGDAAVLRTKLLTAGPIPPGGERSGVLFFRDTTYRRARVLLTDAESDEAEGFSVGF